MVSTHEYLLLHDRAPLTRIHDVVTPPTGANHRRCGHRVQFVAAVTFQVSRLWAAAVIVAAAFVVAAVVIVTAALVAAAGFRQHSADVVGFDDGVALRGRDSGYHARGMVIFIFRTVLGGWLG